MKRRLLLLTLSTRPVVGAYPAGRPSATLSGDELPAALVGINSPGSFATE